MTTQADLARRLDALHVPGDPLIVTNVWDAITAKVVASAPGVKAIATASHAVSFAHGVDDGEGLDVDTALSVARIVVKAVGGTNGLPVSIDFERGYAEDAAGIERNVGRLIETGAVGLNLEDSLPGNVMRPLDDSAARVAAARAAGDAAGVPIVINARVDSLVRGEDWDAAIARANAYLGAGASVIFFLGLRTEDEVRRAIAEVHGRISVISGSESIPLANLARLGVSRVSFGPYSMGLTLSHLH
ncbi:MAG: isocitrate lyase/phosphoenolpyruvate mutase family protein, partial [Actinomycetota bacterium]|nr:isocitrate lyase/phosphoenolpyruvate mutase family protein [Actinomycetota bacterium]